MKNEKGTNQVTKDSQERRRLILQLCAKSELGFGDILRLDELILLESERILKQSGKYFSVKPNNKRKPKQNGDCFGNAATYMQKGCQYVEGYVIDKTYGDRTAHAWNVDKLGNHFDATLDCSQFNYFGIIIPEKIVRDIGYKNGGIWYAVLPFIDRLDF